MYDTLIERPLTNSQRRCMQLNWLYFCGILYQKVWSVLLCTQTTLFWCLRLYIIFNWWLTSAWVNHFSIDYRTLPVILAVNSCFTRYYGYEPYLRLFSFQWKRRSYICISAIFRYQRMFPFPMPKWWTLLRGRQYVHMHLQTRVHWAELWNRYLNWDLFIRYWACMQYVQCCL